MLIANLLGFFAFLYIIWKSLKDDSHSDSIFSLGFSISFVILVTYLFSKYFLNGYWFWLELIGVLITFLVLTLKLRMRRYENFEGVFLGLLVWLGIVFLSDTVVSYSVYSFAAFWVHLFATVLFIFLSTRYKSFVWYKSGKVGFSGLAVLGFLFLVRAVAGIYFKDIISFAPRFEVLFSSIVSFISFLLLYNRSRAK